MKNEDEQQVNLIAKIGLFVIIGFPIIFLGMCTLEHGNSNSLPVQYQSEDNVQSEDKKAYQELRSRGYSDADSKDAASAIRRLCEAGGGTNCQ